LIHQLRIALIVIFLGASAVVGWGLLAEQDRIFQSNVPGIDPSNPLAQFGIESAEHRAYVDAKVRNARWRALEIETAIITVALGLWIVLPVFSKSWTQKHADEV
jgi:hypothetical protein